MSEIKTRYFYQRRPSKVVKRGVADKDKEDEERKPKRSRPTTKTKGGNLMVTARHRKGPPSQKWYVHN